VTEAVWVRNARRGDRPPWVLVAFDRPPPGATGCGRGDVDFFDEHSWQPELELSSEQVTMPEFRTAVSRQTSWVQQ
jgi:hypothetical protein